MKKDDLKQNYNINRQIKAVEVRVVSEEGSTVMPLTKALALAEHRGEDLVEISPNTNPPVCKIIEFSKFLYQIKKRQKEIKAKQVKIEVKEIRFGPQTDEHDYTFKLKHAREFLEEGNKVKAYVFFKGRSIVFKEQGEVLLLRFANDLEEVGKVDSMPELLGKRMTMFISPKKSPTKKVQKTVEQPSITEEKKVTDKKQARQEKKGEYKMPTIEGEEF